jgi:hypothetical protein
MLHKYLFRKGDVPQLYDITKVNNELYALIIPKVVFDSITAGIPEEQLQNHFEIGRLFAKTEENNKVILTFDLSIGGEKLGVAFSHLCSWINDDNLCALLPAGEPKQLCAVTFAGTELAASFAPWTHPYLQDLSIAADFFKYAEEEMKRYNMSRLRRMVPCSYIECQPRKGGFRFELFGNGLWMDGSYKEDIVTHNCYTSVDQFTFFVGLVAVADALKSHVKKQ